MSEPAEGIPRLKAAAPAGAAALVIVAAVVGGTMLTRPAGGPASVVERVVSESVAPVVASPGLAAEPAPASTQTSPAPGPALPGVAFDQSGASAGRPALGVEIVVKFKDDRKVQDMVDTFWKDAPAAQRKFEAFKAGRPEFAGVRLDRVTYSNELVLVPTADLAPDKRAGAARDLAAKMGKAADISYAEANVTAKPGSR